MSVRIPEHKGDGGMPAAKASDALREQAIENLKRKRKFARDATVYVAVNGILWVIWALSDRSTDGSIPWPTWVSAIWGILLALDAWKAYGPWPGSLRRPIDDVEIERELERMTRRRP
jgi:hypothetical protein